MSRRPLDAAELTRRLVQRPAGVTSGRPHQDSHNANENRRPFGAGVSATFAALAIAGGGGGGSGGGQHGGTLDMTDPGLYGAGRYPYWSDNFDDGALAGWTVRAGTWSESAGLLHVDSVSGIGTYRGFITFDDSAGTEDIEAFVTLASANVNNALVGARLNTSALPVGYAVRYNAGKVELRRLAGISSVLLASDATITLVTGDQVGIRCRGTTISAVVNGLTVLSATDATNTAGLCGLISQSTALPSFDDWGTR